MGSIARPVAHARTAERVGNELPPTLPEPHGMSVYMTRPSPIRLARSKLMRPVVTYPTKKEGVKAKRANTYKFKCLLL